MKYLSVCSGIEAATVAWHPLGWQAVAFGEIEKFPSQVLAHHYPDTPNWGDMTKFKEWQDADVNVFVGGTPCQSFSVAGLRKGLDDPRGNLMLTYLAIAARYRPEWLVWENVPGVLSSNGGLDFASLLRGMGELGYGFAYRILDAQYFGVAQRRRRVFVVGYLGNWRPAAAVLFERHSLSGHPAPSRKAREGAAGTITSSIGTGGVDINHPMVPAMHSELCPSLKARDAKGPSSDGDGDGAILVPMVQPIATHDVAGTMLSRNTSGGFSNSIDHAASGYMALQPIALAENTIGRKPENGGNGDGFTEEGPMYTLNATGVHGVAQPIPLNSMNVFRSPDADASTGCGIGEEGEAMFTITKANSHAVAQPMAYTLSGGSNRGLHVNKAQVATCLDTNNASNEFREQSQNAQTLVAQPIALQDIRAVEKMQGGKGWNDDGTAYTIDTWATQGVAQPIGIFQDSEFGIAEYDTAGTLRAGRIPAHQMAIQAVATHDVAGTMLSRNTSGGFSNSIDHAAGGYMSIQQMAVRRLTPKECERLQGFPDNYTDIKPKGKATPDGPRYKALGNSMAVPVMAWIGKRISEVDAICQTQKQ